MREYNFTEIEKKWQDIWDEKQSFAAAAITFSPSGLYWISSTSMFFILSFYS